MVLQSNSEEQQGGGKAIRRAVEPDFQNAYSIQGPVDHSQVCYFESLARIKTLWWVQFWGEHSKPRLECCSHNDGHPLREPTKQNKTKQNENEVKTNENKQNKARAARQGNKMNTSPFTKLF